MSEIETLRKETPHWSYSALNTYIQCPLKYKFRYIDQQEPESTGSCFPFGRAFHAAMSERARQGNSMAELEVQATFESFLKAEIETTENIVYKPGETYDSLLSQGFQMVKVALDNWQDDFAVQSVAESFSVNVPGLRKPLIGEFDMVVIDGNDLCIVDWKTASAKWPAGKADRDLQATAFCYAYREAHQVNPAFRFDVVTKTRSPSINSHYTLRTEDALSRFVYLANEVQRGVDAGVFFPNETGFGCNGCPYAEHCKKSHRR